LDNSKSDFAKIKSQLDNIKNTKGTGGSVFEGF